MRFFSTLAAALVSVTALASVADAGSLWNVDGFDMPESALLDTDRNRIILSNIVGHPMAADGNGTLSLISPDGTVLDKEWTVGMDAPKGMAVLGDKLVVADLTRIHVVDLATGTLEQSLTAPGAKFLNDVTANGQAAFISDMMTHTIWRLGNDGTLSLWLEDAALSHPNGLLWDRDRLLVGSWGSEMAEDFSTKRPGNLLAVDPETRDISVLARSVGNIDGIVKLNGDFYLSDWVSGALLHVSEAGEIRRADHRPAGLADIGAANGVLYLPHMFQGKLEAMTID